jgi:hypothetical protein
LPNVFILPTRRTGKTALLRARIAKQRAKLAQWHDEVGEALALGLTTHAHAAELLALLNRQAARLDAMAQITSAPARSGKKGAGR